MASPFIGCSEELGVLTGALDDARAASPRTVVVTGAAGIGKSTLVRRFLAEVTDATVLRASGEEVEAALPYGVLDQLRAQARAIPVGDAADPLVAGAAFVELLGELQESGPVVVVVDDAHWSDTPSLHALVFALRRLRVDRVLAVLAMREEEAWRVPGGVERLVDGAGGRRIRLNGLTPSQLVELAAVTGAGRLSAAAAHQLHRHTEGNPLYAGALLNELGAERLGRSGVGPLPAPRAYAESILSKVASCPEATQRLVRAGAVLGIRWSVGVAQQLSAVDDALGAAEEAVRTGILAEAHSPAVASMEFAHPLTRAAVYHTLGPGERATLHTRAADLVPDEASALRHRAAAAAGPHPGLVLDLRAFADAQATRNRWAAAADATLSASRLTPSSSEREELLVETFELLIAAGDLAHALALGEEAEAWDQSAGRCYVLSLTRAMMGHLADAEVLLSQAWQRCDPSEERRLAARIASVRCLYHINAGNGPEALCWSARALELDPEGKASTSWPPRLMRVMALAAVRDHPGALRFTSSLPDPLPDPQPHEAGELLGRGIVRLWSDDLAGAWRDLDAVRRTCLRRGPVTLALMALFYLADTEYRLGQWDDAVAHAEMAVSVTDDAGRVLALAFAHSVAAFVAAARGDHLRADDHSRAAAARALDAAQRLWAAVAAARVAQASGDREQQAAACERILDLAGKDTVEQPIVQPWRELYVDALVRLHQLDEAEVAFEPLQAWVVKWPRASAVCGTHRVQGLLLAARGDAAGAHAAFEAALATANQLAMPLVKAEVQLDFGAFLRRRGRRRAALVQLQAARPVLGRLGARPLLERCDDELRACGIDHAPGAHKLPHLTPQELAVARLVADGMTNRDIAAELMLSVKTIEYHLGNLFAKLGVRSRLEMAARLADPAPPARHR